MKREAIFILAILAFISSPVVAADDTSPVPGEQVERVFLASDGAEVDYLLYVPKSFASSQAWPMVFFLHGRGESHGPLSLVAKWGPPRFAAEGQSLPYVLVSPQCPSEDSWKTDTQQGRLVELLDHITESLSVDTDQICLTGLSMGGYGTWRLAADHPSRFKSVVPICGGGDPSDAEALKDLPIWVFHGDRDTAVPFEQSVEMVKAIQQAGSSRIRFTTLEFFGHNCWSAAYATPQLWEWMFDQSKRKRGQSKKTNGS